MANTNCKADESAAIDVSSAGADWRVYRRTWLRTETPLPFPLPPSCWLVFMDSGGLGEQMSIQLAGARHRVIQVRPGKRFVRLGWDKYQIRPDQRADYAALLADITRLGNPPQKIVYLWSVLNESQHLTIEDLLVCSFFGPLYLAQALGQQQLRSVDIAMVSDRLYSVAGEAALAVERATLLGPVRVLPKELPGIVCRSIDCNPSILGVSSAAVQIIAEHCSPFVDPIVAYRGNERWVERIGVLPRNGKDTLSVAAGGTYLISGGLGKRALAIAKELVQRYHANVLLLDESPLPPADRWPAMAADRNTPNELKQTLTQLLELPALGARVKVLSADVTKTEQLATALATTRSEMGEIRGIIHDAGRRDDSDIEAKTPESASSVLGVKIRGARALLELLGSVKCDFVALSSSLVCLIPEPKTIDYVAACSFLDCLAASRRDLPLISINWPESNHGTEPATRVGEVFSSVLALSDARVVAVCDQEIENRLIAERPQHLHHTDPCSEPVDIETVLLDWMKELMAIEECGLDDDFFDLGGESLTGSQLFSRINSQYKTNLGLSQLFEARTVRQLADLIRQEQAQPRPWSPLVPIQPNGKRPPLFVISGVGGNVVKFHGLAFHLGNEQPVYGLLPRGLDGHQAFHTRIEDMAADYVEAIRSMQPEGSYRLAGYSFGGIVAFEVAKQIEEAGGKIAFLGLFDTMEWQYFKSVDRSLRFWERAGALREELLSILRHENRWSQIERMFAPKYSRFRYRLYNALGRPLPQKAGQIEEINSLAVTHYKPRSISAKLTLFRAENRSIHEGNDEFLGWSNYTSGGIELLKVSGTHFNMFQEPAIRILGEKLRSCLASVNANNQEAAALISAQPR